MPSTSIRFNLSQFQMTGWSLLKVTGSDRETFFQGQVTNDLNVIDNFEGQLTARLNRVGKLQSSFFIFKHSNYLLILCQNVIVNQVKADLEKFIIMDDVEILSDERSAWICLNPFLNEEDDKECFKFNIYGINAGLFFNQLHGVEITDSAELEKIRILNGWPLWGTDLDNSQFINDSRLNELAISYKKGCFLGQETAAKIENNRGAANFPVLLELFDKNKFLNSRGEELFCLLASENKKIGKINSDSIEGFFQTSLLRDYRIDGRRLEVNIAGQKITAIVRYLPYYKKDSRKDLALELYYTAIDFFQKNKTNEAKATLKKALKFDPLLADAYESLGVILGREEAFQEAIEWMDQLLVVNPNSVMAHTNKSLYLMRLGKIEEAEAEKSLATVKSFGHFGEEAKLKKQLLEEERVKLEDTLRREKMFLQVLEIDSDDTIALFGMADIFFQRKSFIEAVQNLVKVIAIDEKYSTAYLLLGKSQESLDLSDEAIKTYQAGILIASNRGDMMPANEMQSRLNQLVMRSSGR